MTPRRLEKRIYQFASIVAFGFAISAAADVFLAWRQTDISMPVGIYIQVIALFALGTGFAIRARRAGLKEPKD
jgi:hypothetical protein